jgi:hypothetical protein
MKDGRAMAWGDGEDPSVVVADLTTPADAAMAREQRPYLSLADALSLRVGPDGDFETSREMEARLDAWEAFLSFIFQGGRLDPWHALKNLLAVVRRVRPEFLGGLTATQVAFLLGETKAAVSAREIGEVEDTLRRWGVRGYHCVGGAKTESTREASARAAKGNRNRRRAAARRRKKDKGNGKGKGKGPGPGAGPVQK